MDEIVDRYMPLYIKLDIPRVTTARMAVADFYLHCLIALHGTGRARTRICKPTGNGGAIQGEAIHQ